MNRSQSPRIKMRPAGIQDIPKLELWDRQPHVIAATTDDPSNPEFTDWKEELAPRDDGTEFFIADLSNRPIGVIGIIDPKRERTHYWGDAPANLRALDIWIGDSDCLGQGYGTQMMEWAINYCFHPADVEAILIDPLYINRRAQKFYRRLGFVDVERRQFDETSDCLVMRLDR